MHFFYRFVTICLLSKSLTEELKETREKLNRTREELRMTEVQLSATVSGMCCVIKYLASQLDDCTSCIRTAVHFRTS